MLLDEIRQITEWLRSQGIVIEFFADGVWFLAKELGENMANIGLLQSFEQNIIRPGISAELDEMIQLQNTNVAILNGIQEYFNKRLAKDKNDTTEYVKKHETEKSCVGLQLTKKRATTLKDSIKADNTMIDILGAKFKLSDVKFVSVSTSADETIITSLGENTDTQRSSSSNVVGFI